MFERGDWPSQWLASVKELPQCHTFGRGLEQTRARIREALVLWKGKAAADAELLEVLPLPSPAKRKLDELHDVRTQLEQLEERKQTLLAGLVDVLKDVDLSMRDIGTLTGVSHQRVNQVGRSRKARRQLPRNGEHPHHRERLRAR